MNITPWELYWILQLDQIRSILEVICFFSTLALATFLSVALLTSDDTKRPLKKACIYVGIISVFSALLLMFMPTTRQLMVVKVMPVIMNTESAQKELTTESAELYGLVKQYLRENMNKEVEK